MNPTSLGIVRIAVGLLFIQHGAEKLWGFAGGKIDHNFLTLRGFAGPLEILGGSLIILGLFTRVAAFILCGEMAVAYFVAWAGRGFLPISNGGEEAVIFSFIYLWLVTAGPGAWSLDRKGLGERKLAAKLNPLESHGRAIVRVILAFTFMLHGYRHVFGILSKSAGRAAIVPVAIDSLPAFVGYWEVLGGLLLLVGLWTRPAAIVTCVELFVAYCYAAAPRGIWPIRNGGNEVLLYLTIFSFLAVCGGGKFSVDSIRSQRRQTAPVRVAAGTA